MKSNQKIVSKLIENFEEKLENQEIELKEPNVLKWKGKSLHDLLNEMKGTIYPRIENYICNTFKAINHIFLEETGTRITTPNNPLTFRSLYEEIKELVNKLNLPGNYAKKVKKKLFFIFYFLLFYYFLFFIFHFLLFFFKIFFLNFFFLDH